MASPTWLNSADACPQVRVVRNVGQGPLIHTLQHCPLPPERQQDLSRATDGDATDTAPPKELPLGRRRSEVVTANAPVWSSPWAGPAARLMAHQPVC
jgi:hypothetical protein